jgi:hypothetical protein
MFNQNAFLTEVYTEASLVGIRAMLYSGKRIIMRLNIKKKANRGGVKILLTKIGVMAMILVVNKWQCFLLAIKLTIYTDFQTLIYLRARQDLRSQIAMYHLL